VSQLVVRTRPLLPLMTSSNCARNAITSAFTGIEAVTLIVSVCTVSLFPQIPLQMLLKCRLSGLITVVKSDGIHPLRCSPQKVIGFWILQNRLVINYRYIWIRQMYPRYWGLLQLLDFARCISMLCELGSSVSPCSERKKIVSFFLLPIQSAEFSVKQGAVWTERLTLF